jgi:hypothetical protein
MERNRVLLWEDFLLHRPSTDQLDVTRPGPESLPYWIEIREGVCRELGKPLIVNETMPGCLGYQRFFTQEG